MIRWLLFLIWSKFTNFVVETKMLLSIKSDIVSYCNQIPCFNSFYEELLEVLTEKLLKDNIKFSHKTEIVETPEGFSIVVINLKISLQGVQEDIITALINLQDELIYILIDIQRSYRYTLGYSAIISTCIDVGLMEDVYECSTESTSNSNRGTE